MRESSEAATSAIDPKLPWQVLACRGVACKSNMTDWNRPQPAPRALWDFIHANFPTVRNLLGIYNNRMVAGTNIPSHHAEGRALDLGLRAWIPTEKWLGDELFKIFVGDVNPRDVDEVIWNRQIWSAQRPYVHVHHGANPHIDLIHCKNSSVTLWYGGRWPKSRRLILGLSRSRASKSVLLGNATTACCFK
jgi:hypothetical protein